MEWQICQELKCLPHELGKEPKWKVHQMHEFMKAEAEAATLKEKQSTHYSTHHNGRRS